MNGKNDLISTPTVADVSDMVSTGELPPKSEREKNFDVGKGLTTKSAIGNSMAIHKHRLEKIKQQHEALVKMSDKDLVVPAPGVPVAREVPTVASSSDPEEEQKVGGNQKTRRLS